MHVDQRRLRSSLAPYEPGEQHRRHDDAGHEGRREPPGVPLGDREQQRRERRDQQEGAGRIEAAILGERTRFRRDQPGEDNAEDGERNGDPEDPAPAERT
jgi:hypothetical protein